jgi:hypothetical protein
MTPKAALPTDPCQLLTIAQDALIKLLTGTAVISVETPQLGRVEYNRADTDKLQRLVDQLTSQCNAQQGITTTSGRKPFSFEAWP